MQCTSFNVKPTKMLSDPVAEAFGLIHRHPRVKSSAVCDADQGLGLQIKWEGDVDDPIIKLRDIKQKVPVVTIHLYKSKLKIMIQGSYISKWREEEFRVFRNW